jgi:hypothetical protein
MTQNATPTEDLNLEDLIAKAKYKQHPYGKTFQPLDNATFKALAADIGHRGPDKETVLYQDMVLDGWHGYLACLAKKRDPKFAPFKGSDLEAAELVHASGIRRHVSADQRYASFVLLCEACPAFKQKYEQLKAKGEQQRKAGTPLDTGSQRVDVVKAKAEAAGVSKATAKKVERVKKDNPGAVANIAAGRTTANKELKKSPGKGRKPGRNRSDKPTATVKDGKSSQDQDVKKAPLLSCVVDLELRIAKGKSVHEVRNVLFLGKAEFKGLHVWHKNAKAVPVAPGAPLPKGCLAEVTAIRSAHNFKVGEA